MFNRLFRRDAPPADIDSLVKEVADHKRPADYDRFLKNFAGCEFYFPLAGEVPPNVPIGERITVPAGANVLARTASLNGQNFLLLFTSRSHPSLGDKHAGLVGKEALYMVDRSQELAGLIVQSTGTGWVGLDRKQVADVLSRA